MAALVAILLFSPAAFIYGRYRARLLRARPGTLGSRLTALLPMPLLLGVCAAIAIIYQRERETAMLAGLRGAAPPRSLLQSGNGIVDAALTVARWLGQVELILFMLAIPFILGAIVAAALLVLDARGRLTLALPAEAEEPGAAAETDGP